MNKLFIKNMVCPRCIKVVRDELEYIGIKISHIKLGEVDLVKPISKSTLEKVSKIMKNNGFELIDDKNSKIVERLKEIVISVIQNYEDEELSSIKFPKYISNKLNRDYTYLSTLFSKMEGITLEHYIILQKIEKVKEYLKYNELTLSEISYKLGYSSVQHLSRQFKKYTGMTATEFKDDHSIHRLSIDSIS